ncbi:recombinase family protein [Nocardioides bruguierae]|uniref:Recombinase family protein n=1 Tax=Nocardioides bruguierae TaxID=2945102 RepID=A0A9X2D6E9_9ACTN|nr:recombinase family protein [Nocardioides bruguierae]MCM0620026.1 recombinase family protein [Nocardioides bruguierae]
MTKKAVVYARLSASKDTSISIPRQLESGRSFCEARGWEVVGEFQDDGVSATRQAPLERKGWQALAEVAGSFDAVVIWKMDRLARNTLDFLETQRWLEAQGAGVVAVDGSVDMTSSHAKMMTTVVAAFAEFEAAQMASRVRAARSAKIRAGLRPGGKPTFGWRNVPSPRGDGYVLAHDPQRIGVVSELVSRALQGHSLYSMRKWLTETGVETRPRRRAGADRSEPPVSARWHEASVEAILRSPTLAGMTVYDSDLLRGDDGMPVVDPSVAIISPAERRSLLAILDGAKRPGSRQREGREPALLYGIVRCASCDGLLYRATAAGKYKQYRCQHQGCQQPVGINRPLLEMYVVDRVLEERGAERSIVSVRQDSGPDLELVAEIDAEINETALLLTRDSVDSQAVLERLESQKRTRAEAIAAVSGEPVYRVTTFALIQDWARTRDVESRRQLLLGHVDAVRISGTGRRGRGLDTDRVQIVWRERTLAERDLRERQQVGLSRSGLRIS